MDSDASQRGRTSTPRRSNDKSPPEIERETDAELACAYRGKADELLAEIEELLGEQSWPSE